MITGIQKDPPINLKKFCEALQLEFIEYKGRNAFFKKDGKIFQFPSRIFRYGREPKPEKLFYGFDTIQEFADFKSAMRKKNAYRGLDSRSFQDGFISALVKMHGHCPNCQKDHVKNESEGESTT